MYWPAKPSVMVKRNVVFNENDIQTPKNYAIIQGDTLSEGERDKIIQQPTNNVENTRKPDNQPVSNLQIEDKPAGSHQNSQPSNSVSFPTTSEPTSEAVPETKENDQNQSYGQGHRPRKPLGAYKDMNDGLVAAVFCGRLEDEEDSVAKIPEDDDGLNFLPPDFALIGGLNSDPHSLNEALQGPNGKDWQTALEYEISLKNSGLG